MTEDTLSMISDVRLDASEIIVEFTVSINSTEVAVVLNLIIHLIYVIFLTSLFCYILTREHDRNIITLLYNSVIWRECHG